MSDQPPSSRPPFSKKDDERGGESTAKDSDTTRNVWGRFAWLGTEFAAAVGGLTIAGYWVDRRYDTSPWGVLVGAMMGLVGGMYNLVRQALAAVREGESFATRRDSGNKD